MLPALIFVTILVLFQSVVAPFGLRPAAHNAAARALLLGRGGALPQRYGIGTQQSRSEQPCRVPRGLPGRQAPERGTFAAGALSEDELGGVCSSSSSDDRSESDSEDKEDSSGEDGPPATASGKLWNTSQFPTGMGWPKAGLMRSILAAQAWECPCTDQNCIGAGRVDAIELYKHREDFMSTAPGYGGLREAERRKLVTLAAPPPSPRFG